MQALVWQRAEPGEGVVDVEHERLRELRRLGPILVRVRERRLDVERLDAEERRALGQLARQILLPRGRLAADAPRARMVDHH